MQGRGTSGPATTNARRVSLLARSALIGVCLALPASAIAQGTAAISGTVRDTTGAVLPGVTVEAGSPALIE